MTTENQGQPPVNPSLVPSLPQQEKRWTWHYGAEREFNLEWITTGDGKTIIDLKSATDAHNAEFATLSEPKPETDAETIIQEIKDLFAIHGSGDYTPTEDEKAIIDASLHGLLRRLLLEPDAPSDNAQAVLQNTLPVQRYPKGCITGDPGDERSLYKQILWELENAGDILLGDGYNRTHGRIQALLERAKLVAPSVVAGVEEKRWETKHDEAGSVLTMGSRKIAFPPGYVKTTVEIADAHNASLGEPRGELAAAHVLENALKECPWPADVWLSTLKEVGDAMRVLHVTEAAITSISGTLMRHGWQCAEKKIQEILSEQGVGEHATGVLSDKEVARELIDDIENYLSNNSLIFAAFGTLDREKITRKALTAIRKAKSLSEPKKLEEEKQ